MIIGTPKECLPGEQRVALVPDLVPKLTKAGLRVLVQSGAGAAAGFPDTAYMEKGAGIEPDVFAQADVLLKVQPPTPEEIGRLKEGAALIGLLQPATNTVLIEALAARRVTAFALELMPRISRAQAMDALSAMSNVAGYKAVLLAANRLPKFFPLLMTAAGTITPARVLILGAGVAGLQAIGTARRLGAVVEAYDPRPVVKEQVESLGAKFVDLGLETGGAETAGGYAKDQGEEFYQKQRERLGVRLAAADVAITTALVPGRRAPILITGPMAEAMRPGSVIVDLAAEQGGNCALTEAGREVVHQGVIILGPVNLPSQVPFHASQLYASTVINFLLYILKDGTLAPERDEELTRGPMVAHQGQVLLKR